MSFPPFDPSNFLRNETTELNPAADFSTINQTEKAANEVAQHIFSSTGQTVTVLEVLKAMRGEACSAIACATVPSALSELQQSSTNAMTSRDETSLSFATPADSELAEGINKQLFQSNSASVAREEVAQSLLEETENPPGAGFAKKRAREESEISSESKDDALPTSKRAQKEGDVSKGAEVSLIEAEDDELHLSFITAVQEGKLKKLQLLKAEAEVIEEDTWHHAFVLAARYGHREVLDWIVQTYSQEIPEDWLYYAISEAIHRDSLQGLRHISNQDGSLDDKIEVLKGIVNCLDDQQSFEMLKHLLSLRKLSQEVFESGVCEHIADNCHRPAFRYLFECKENPMTFHLRKSIVRKTYEGVCEDVGKSEAFLRDCFTLNLVSHEERVWGLQMSATLNPTEENKAIVRQKLETGNFSLLDRTDYEDENHIHPELAFFLFTVGLQDNAQNRSWALQQAISLQSEIDGKDLLIDELFAHYEGLDASKIEGNISNYGLSNEDVLEILLTAYKEDRFNLNYLYQVLEEFTISEQLVSELVKQLKTTPEASEVGGCIYTIIKEEGRKNATSLKEQFLRYFLLGKAGMTLELGKLIVIEALNDEQDEDAKKEIIQAYLSLGQEETNPDLPFFLSTAGFRDNPEIRSWALREAIQYSSKIDELFAYYKRLDASKGKGRIPNYGLSDGDVVKLLFEAYRADRLNLTTLDSFLKNFDISEELLLELAKDVRSFRYNSEIVPYILENVKKYGFVMNATLSTEQVLQDLKVRRSQLIHQAIA